MVELPSLMPRNDFDSREELAGDLAAFLSLLPIEVSDRLAADAQP